MIKTNEGGIMSAHGTSGRSSWGGGRSFSRNWATESARLARSRSAGGAAASVRARPGIPRRVFARVWVHLGQERRQGRRALVRQWWSGSENSQKRACTFCFNFLWYRVQQLWPGTEEILADDESGCPCGPLKSRGVNETRETHLFTTLTR